MITDIVGLLIIGVFSLLYCFFTSSFAELHIKLPVIQFPIFVGELLIVVCLLLLLTKWRLKQIRFGQWIFPLVFYALFILAKAFWGYWRWGPLAFRHAALFYYPIFTLFVYHFTRKDILNNRVVMLLFIISSLTCLRFGHFGNYYLITFFLLSFIFIRLYPYNRIRMLSYGALFVLTPYRYFFDTSRTFLISNIVVAAFFLSSVLIISRMKSTHKIFLSIAILVFILWGSLRYVERNNMTSLLNIEGFKDRYKENKDLILSREYNFVPVQITNRNVYNPNPVSPQRTVSQIKSDIPMKVADDRIARETQLQAGIVKEKEEVRSFKNYILKNIRPKGKWRDLSQAYNSSIFRVLIWEDILKELKDKRPILGFSFGKPFRSRNLEILTWAEREWSRDGWVAMHNGYLDIVYRSGVFGILLILILFIKLFLMIKKAISIYSWEGLAICAIIINWLIAANFLEILELPYTAVPFWSLFGIALAFFKIIDNDGIRAKNSY